MKRIMIPMLPVAAVLLGLSSLSAAEQTAGTCKVQGTVFLDQNSNGKFDEDEELPAKIVLLVLRDGQWVQVEASYTVENGVFMFSDLPTGTYRVQFEFAGNVKRTTESFTLTPEDSDAVMSIPIGRNQQPNLAGGIPGAPPSPDTNSGLLNTLSGIAGSATLPGTLSLGGGAPSPFGFVNPAALLGDEVSNFRP